MKVFELPADCTSAEARQRIDGFMGSLRRELGKAQHLAETQARIIERQNADLAGRTQRIEDLLAQVARLRHQGAEALAVEHEREETARWRSIAAHVYAALGELISVENDGKKAIPAADIALLQLVDTPPAAIQEAPAKQDAPEGIIHRHCVVSWCPNAVQVNGYCHKHHFRYKTYGDACLCKRGRDGGRNGRGGYVLMRETAPDKFEEV